MQFKADGTVDEAVEDGVGEGGIVELAMPVGHRQLGGDDHRAAAQAVVEDLEEVAAAGGVDRGQSPVEAIASTRSSLVRAQTVSQRPAGSALRSRVGASGRRATVAQTTVTPRGRAGVNTASPASLP